MPSLILDHVKHLYVAFRLGDVHRTSMGVPIPLYICNMRLGGDGFTDFFCIFTPILPRLHICAFIHFWKQSHRSKVLGFHQGLAAWFRAKFTTLTSYLGQWSKFEHIFWKRLKKGLAQPPPRRELLSLVLTLGIVLAMLLITLLSVFCRTCRCGGVNEVTQATWDTQFAKHDFWRDVSIF